jgi:hypothetical protein
MSWSAAVVSVNLVPCPMAFTLLAAAGLRPARGLLKKPALVFHYARYLA